MTRLWIIDGHNVIFAVPRLQRLQVSGLGHDAREALVRALRPFATARRQEVLIVFDGDDLERNPGAFREPFLEVVYARRGDEEADDRIVHRAKASREQGRHVTVVTNDRQTLAARLPPGTDHLQVETFWERHVLSARLALLEKRVEGDFSDVEREMAAQAASGAEPVRGRPGPPARDAGAGPARPIDAARERLGHKKERGRARQERRLKRRSDRSRR